jgi:hypothetical protein
VSYAVCKFALDVQPGSPISLSAAIMRLTEEASMAAEIIPFPARIVTPAERAYREELKRVDHLEYEGKRARFNKRIRKARFAGLRGPGGWFGA